MKPIFAAPQSALDRKPPHGLPCTSCGLCCMATLCDLGRYVFGKERGRCPALEEDGEHRYTCGLAKRPKHYVESDRSEDELQAATLFLIWAGLGCDARFNGEWVNKAFHKLGDEYDRQNRGCRIEAMKVWKGGKSR